MKIRKLFILLIGAFAIVVMLVSCTTSSHRPTFTLPSINARPIETTMIEVTGDKGEKLRVEISLETGKCKKLWVNDVEKKCDDKEIVIPIKQTFFCITSPDKEQDDGHPANTAIYDNIHAYCGNVQFITNGTDIKFKKSDSAAGNKKCKYIGGDWICYP